MQIAIALLVAFLVMYLVIYLFSKEEGKQEGAFLGRIGLSLLMLATVSGIGFVVFLLFKGVGYAFQHVIIFENNTAIFTTVLYIVVVSFILSITVYSFLHAVSNILYSKFKKKAISLAFYSILKIIIDSLAIYIILQSVPGVEIKNGYIAIFLATLLFIPDFLFPSKEKKTEDNTYNTDNKG